METLQERRQRPRIEYAGRVQMKWLAAPGARAWGGEASSLNLSDAGVCLRLREAVELHSWVRLRLLGQSGMQPLECAGRVAWVMQRLDLRPRPPFLYDVGVEFVDPPARLTQLMAQGDSAASVTTRRPAKVRGLALEPLALGDRRYTPRLAREASNPRQRAEWHLVITVDDVPCLSQRFGTAKEAVAAWEQFMRKAKRKEASR